MKFKSNLDYYQNLHAWRAHCMSTPRKGYNKINAGKRAWLLQLNKLLSQLEDQFLPILDVKYNELQARVKDDIGIG